MELDPETERRERLRNSYEIFGKRIVEILEATQKLRLRLGIEEGSQMNLGDRVPLIETCKRNVSFIRKKKECRNILSTIQASIVALERLPGIVQPFNEAQQKSHWKDFQLRLMCDDELPPTPATLVSTSATPSPKLKVKWALLTNFLPFNKPRLPPSTTQPVTQTATPPPNRQLRKAQKRYQI
ncbi:hypothetical protein CIB48_g3824 [Xylaria polymorpha]|nr:hypothetical protein CIB48_g3824 [Xylaria polymorpha]